MTPFEKYMEESKQIREKYNILMLANPERKPELLIEMQNLLASKLDECEKQEIERSKHL